jgi:hypothetical protein
MPRTFEDPEAARAAGQESARVRAARSTMTPEQRALADIQARLGKLTQELIRAALGEGDFEDLKGETRVAALKTLMEYGLGKPTAGGKTEAADSEPTGPSPEDLFTRPNVEASSITSVEQKDA